MVTSGQNEYHVVGVVKDFNYTSPRQAVGPLVMMLRFNRGSILVKLNATDIQSFLADIKAKWDRYNSDNTVPFTYTFLDEKFGALYANEERTSKIFTAFASIAIIIAGLGLFGLSTFSAEQRVREIGIRKVLGASARQILLMLSKQFMILVLICIRDRDTAGDVGHEYLAPGLCLSHRDPVVDLRGGGGHIVRHCVCIDERASH